MVSKCIHLLDSEINYLKMTLIPAYEQKINYTKEEDLLIRGIKRELNSIE